MNTGVGSIILGPCLQLLGEHIRGGMLNRCLSTTTLYLPNQQDTRSHPHWPVSALTKLPHGHEAVSHCGLGCVSLATVFLSPLIPSSFWDWEKGEKLDYFHNGNPRYTRVTAMEYLNGQDCSLLLTATGERDWYAPRPERHVFSVCPFFTKHCSQGPPSF